MLTLKPNTNLTLTPKAKVRKVLKKEKKVVLQIATCKQSVLRKHNVPSREANP